MLNDNKFFYEELSEFLNINSGISYILTKNKPKENSSNYFLNENVKFNNFFEILYNKVKKYFKNLLDNFNIIVMKKKFFKFIKIFKSFSKKKNFQLFNK